MTRREFYREPPGPLDDLVAWFDQVSQALVLLEPFPIADVRGAVHALRRGMEAHLRGADRLGAGDGPPVDSGSRLERVVRSQHERFAVSLDQLDWFLAIVEREDHGGHRQALGQYGRLLAEAFRWHRELERALEADAGATVRPAPPGKSN
jgi:hypothetical protein